MKKLYNILFVLLLTSLSACNKNQFVLFDSPYAYITDESGKLSEMIINKNSNNLLTTLSVHLSASGDNSYPILVEYEVIIGDGLKENVDFKLNPATASPLVFEKNTYDLPIEIAWMKNSDFDETRKNTLEIKLTGSSLPEMLLGLPGPNHMKQSFIFIKSSL